MSFNLLFLGTTYGLYLLKVIWKYEAFDIGMCTCVFNSGFGDVKASFSVAIQFYFAGWVHVKTATVITGIFEKKHWVSAKGAKTVVGFSVYFPPKLQVDLRSALHLRLFFSVLCWMSNNLFFFCLFPSEQIYFFRWRDNCINTIPIHFCEMQEGISSPAAYTYMCFQHNLNTGALPFLATDCWFNWQLDGKYKLLLFSLMKMLVAQLTMKEILPLIRKSDGLENTKPTKIYFIF